MEKVHEGASGNICPQGPTFHWRNGWMFCRGEGLYVHIWNIERGIDLAMPPAEWDSLVKSLSAGAR